MKLAGTPMFSIAVTGRWHQYGACSTGNEFLASCSMGQLAQSDAILSWLRQREDEMAALLAEVVSVPTENPPGKNYRACVDLLESRLRKASLSCERFVSGVSTDDALDPPVCRFHRSPEGTRVIYFHG